LRGYVALAEPDALDADVADLDVLDLDHGGHA